MATFLEGLYELIPKLLNFYVIIIIGIIWRFSKFYKPKYGELITKFVIWILFPISIIASFSGVESFNFEILIVVSFVTVLIHLLSFFTIYLMSKDRPSYETGALIFCSTFPNALLFPFPIILAIIGTPGIIYAAIFVFIAMLIRNSFGVMIGVYFNPINTDNTNKENEEVKIEIRKVLIDLIKFPPFIALILGIIINGIFGSKVISDIPGLDIIKTISSYGALILIGASFQSLTQLKPKNFISRDVIQVGIVRFIFVPAITLLVFILLGFSSIMAIPLLIQSMAPPAVSNIIYGKFFFLDETKISLIITSLTFFALIVLPFELFILLQLFPIS